MRIVFLAPVGKIGGAERCLLDVLASLRSAEPDWPIHLIAGGDGPLLSAAAGLGVATTALTFPAALARIGDAVTEARRNSMASRAAKLISAGVPIWRYRAELGRHLRRLVPDVIHTNGFKMHMLAAWSRPRNAALVWHVHDYASARPLMSSLLRRYAACCSMAIANSNSVAEDLRALTGERLPVGLIRNAIDLAKYSPEGPMLDLDALCKLPPAPVGTVRIGLVATMARWKGHKVFLEAVAAIPPELPVRAYIVGGPVYETEGSQFSIDELRGFAASLGIGGRIGFTGYLQDTAAAMRTLDVVVHASTDPEPFGLVIAEAMACGRAVIFSAAGGAAEVACPGVTALAHRPGDVAGLATCMERLIADPSLRARFADAGRQEAKRFDRGRLAEELVPLYRGLVGAT
jgi:glycosyltransferase involved in cell wall biosynthesis